MTAEELIVGVLMRILFELMRLDIYKSLCILYLDRLNWAKLSCLISLMHRIERRVMTEMQWLRFVSSEGRGIIALVLVALFRLNWSVLGRLLRIINQYIDGLKELLRIIKVNALQMPSSWFWRLHIRSICRKISMWLRFLKIMRRF